MLVSAMLVLTRYRLVKETSTFFFSILRTFFSRTTSTCFMASDWVPVSWLVAVIWFIDPGADPKSGLADFRVLVPFVAEGI